MKSEQEKALDKTFKHPPTKHCAVCGSPEGYGPDGKPVRMIALGGDKWACNYCNNQGLSR
jgi:hypothetical protein